MPTTYAHYRFGNIGLSELQDDVKDNILKYRGLYDIGLHGPDIFFYHNVYKSNPVTQFGHNMHKKPMSDFLKNAKTGYENFTLKPALLSYIIGFVGHFTLDSCCHTFVEEMTDDDNGLSHDLIESRFDRYLMVLDGLDPIKTSRGFSLKPGHKTAKVISMAFPEWSADTIYRTTSNQKIVIDALTIKNEAKRFLLEGAFSLAGKKGFSDLLIEKNDDPSCENINATLLKHFNEALEKFPSLVSNAIDYIENDEPLDDYFNRHFGAWYENETN